MNIQEFTIKHYKSLYEVKAEPTNFTVFIGKNGSGKTTILEALHLFFNDFNLIGGATSPILTDISAWYDKRPTHPIEFILKIKLDEEECRDIFPEKILELIKKRYKERYHELTFHRQIPKPGEPWTTKHVKVADLFLVKDDSLLSPEEITESLTEKIPKPPGSIKAYLFDPNASQSDIVGARLIVLDDKAYPMNDYVDTMVRDGIIPFEHLPEVDKRAWTQEKGLTPMEKSPPTKEEIAKFFPELLVTNEILNEISVKIVKNIKGRFKLVPATRDVRVPVGVRESFLDKATIIDPFIKLPTSEKPLDDEKYDTIRNAIEDLLSKRLATHPRLSTWEWGSRFPIHMIGGGEQGIIGLLWELYSHGKLFIFSVEEPETHLHPGLSTKFFELLKKESGETQIIIVTHSPTFIDRVEFKNNWIVEKERKKTEIRRVKKLKEVLDQVGAQSSDRIIPNKVLFVAGETEEDILPIWLEEKMGIDVDYLAIQINRLQGELDKRKVEVLQDFLKDTQTEVFLMVDHHGKDLADKAIKKGLDKKNCLVLPDTIEDCYPIRILVEILNEIYDINLTEDEIDSKKPKGDEIKRILKDKRGISKTKWKRPVGKEVALRMSKEDIPSEIKEFLKKLVPT